MHGRQLLADQITQVAAFTAKEVEAIVCNGHHLPSDADSFFGPDTSNVHFLPAWMTLADLLTMAGVFESNSQARKAGFLDFEPGFTTKLFRRKHIRVTVFNPTE